MKKLDRHTVFGSYERCNRVLYGGHANDDDQGRFFTFAGDTPFFMGASSDYTRDTWCYQAKNGVLISGLATTPGFEFDPVYDSFSAWFHNSSDIVSKWHHGYMSYELTRFSAYFPAVKVRIEVYPVNPDDGFLVHYDITTDQRVIFCAGFGGITPFFGRFEYHTSYRRDFSAEDCKDNTAEIGCGFAKVCGPGDVSMLIGTDFECRYELDSAAAMEEKFPSKFLSAHDGGKTIVKLRRELLPGEHFRGNILVLRNSSPETLKKYFTMSDPRAFLRGKIREKFAAVGFHTPDAVLNDSVPDTMIALDASFHGKSFYHGAIGYHAPFLGWRGWYAPTLLGWTGRVRSAIKSHFDTITRFEGKERVWWDGADRPDLDHEGTQYHHLENSSGHLTALLHRDDIYDMQEVAVDMTLHYLEHTGDYETAAVIYDRLCEILDWEERVLDPDHDGLYQNFLNTWISDGHSYNGAGCAQASSYNYAANLRAAKLGRKLGKDVSKLEARAAKIQQAFQQKIWLEGQGVPAESIDTIGNKLVHPSPELSTLYLAADCDNTSPEQSFRMLRWAERNIPFEITVGRGGKIYYSSNWKPKKYSTQGLFPAENAALALAYFQIGQRDKAMEIVNGLADAFTLSPYPGSITHVMSAHGGADGGDIDFTDVSSCYLRLLIEGLWGIRFRLLDDCVTLSPRLPDEWEQASISLPDIDMTLCRSKQTDSYTVSLRSKLRKIIRLPLRFAAVDQLFVNGKEHDYTIIPGFGLSFLEFRTDESDMLEVKICYDPKPYPELVQKDFHTFGGNLETLTARNGSIRKVIDFNHVLEVVKPGVFRIVGQPGSYDILVQAGSGDFAVLLPAQIDILSAENIPAPKHFAIQNPLLLSSYFNASLTEIHKQEFKSPRPEGYSIGMRLNGRYAWEWNHFGHNALNMDDSGLRNCGGEFVTASGIKFATPAQGDNSVTVSLWDNFPTTAEIPLSGKADELAVLLCGTTNAMQSYVVNARLKVIYKDGSEEIAELIPPENFDDLLIAAFQKRNETVYFSDGTHGLVQKIALDPEKELSKFSVEAVANEVIVNILALTLMKDER